VRAPLQRNQFHWWWENNKSSVWRKPSKVHGHKYSSPSIFYYIFHIKPHFFQIIFYSYLWADFYEIYLKTRRILWIVFL
jgi:hypothetical protein